MEVWECETFIASSLSTKSKSSDLLLSKKVWSEFTFLFVLFHVIFILFIVAKCITNNDTDFKFLIMIDLLMLKNFKLLIICYVYLEFM